MMPIPNFNQILPFNELIVNLFFEFLRLSFLADIPCFVIRNGITSIVFLIINSFNC